MTSETVSHEKLYAKLSGCMIDEIKIKNVGLTTHNMTTPNEDQEELLNRIRLKQLLRTDIVKKIRTEQ